MIKHGKKIVEYLFSKLGLEKIGLDVRFINFLFIGGINTLFGYSIFALLIFFGLHYSLANLIAIVVGVIFNFFTTGNFVFKNNNKKLIFKFILVYSITWFINTFFMFIAKKNGVGNLYMVGAVLLLPCAFISFILMKYFVFNKWETDGSKNEKD